MPNKEGIYSTEDKRHPEPCAFILEDEKWKYIVLPAKGFRWCISADGVHSDMTVFLAPKELAKW